MFDSRKLKSLGFNLVTDAWLYKSVVWRLSACDSRYAKRIAWRKISETPLFSVDIPRYQWRI